MSRAKLSQRAIRNYKAKPHPRTQPLDLREVAGRDYKLALDESWWVEREEFRSEEFLWSLKIPCRNPAVHICPWGKAGSATELAVVCGRGSLGNRLFRLPGAVLLQDADDGRTIGFPRGLFEQVAELVKPRKRQRPRTDAERAAAQERLAKYRFRPAQEINFEGQTGPIGPSVDS